MVPLSSYCAQNSVTLPRARNQESQATDEKFRERWDVIAENPLRASKRSGRCSHGLTEPDMRRIAVQSRVPCHQEIERTQLLRCFYEAQVAIPFDSRAHACG